VAISYFTKFTGLGYEDSAYALCALFIAGACATLVRITRRQFDDHAAWCACLVALAIPAFNGYREFLIREFGFWFFCLLAILAALRRHSRSSKSLPTVSAQPFSAAMRRTTRHRSCFSGWSP
jgi:hypothetical protein